MRREARSSGTRRATLCLLGVGLVLQACAADVAGVPLRITHAPEQDPFRDATELSLRFSRAGVLERQQSFPADTQSLDLGVLAFGEDLQIELVVLAGEFEIARGASFPFRVQPSSPPPRVDVHVGRLERFTDAGVEPLDGPVMGSSAGPSGALVATAKGTLYRYDAHAPADGRPQLTRLAAYVELAGASWLALADGGLLAVGGDLGRARRFGPDGELVVDVRSVELDDQRRGATLVSVDGAAIALGGSPLEFGGMTTHATRIVPLPDGGLDVVALPALACPTRDGAASRVSIPSVSGGATERIALVCGDALRESRLLVFDPSGASASMETVLPGDLRAAAMAPLGVGLLLVAGGRDPEGVPSDAVHVLALGDGSSSEIAGGSRPLFGGRAGAAASVLSPGRVLLVGGRDALERPLASAEVVTFPGRVVLTGDTPMPMASPHVIELADGTLLAVDASGMAQYVPRR
ncbi:MAG: hypothetical protein GXP55_25845 [Deltaproteobacteria bacterium]|nr:hypothetical protein [Deltaproteobacteria bacterium]